VNPDHRCPLTATVGSGSWPVQVGDISTSGISFTLPQRIEPESVLNLSLTNTAQLFSRVLILRAIHVRENEEGLYVVGAQFSRELTYDELRSLLA